MLDTFVDPYAASCICGNARLMRSTMWRCGVHGTIESLGERVHQPHMPQLWDGDNS